jgi:regulatory protein
VRSNQPKTGRATHPSKQITPESLNEAALSYLERYVASSDHLRGVLMRRVRRAAKDQELDTDEARRWVDDIVERFRQVGLLNDEAYARGQARRLLRQGTSLRGIRLRLSAKGVHGGDIDQALETLTDEVVDPELQAATTYARRRRLGPFGPPEGRDERRQKELGAMARAGFSFDMAQRVLEAEDPGDEDR